MDTAKLFWDGQRQAVRLPERFWFEGDPSELGEGDR